MHQMREDLDIIFRRTLPETALKKMYVNTDKRVLLYPRKDYLRIAYGIFTEYSEDELVYRHKALDECCEQDGIFELLYEYADQVLTKRDGKITVRLEYILGWNSIARRLGQDLFTTAWLAYRDCGNFAPEHHQFVWPAVLQADDVKLNLMLQKGTAENHFHLNGSTQSFALSWTSLMNHPNRIEEFLKIKDNFEVNRNSNISRGVDDNVLPWKERIAYAAMIRALLFKKIVSNDKADEIENEFRSFCRMPLISKIQMLVTSLRKLYGVRVKQPDQREKCLDYAMSRSFYDVRTEAENRLLSGERAFLYHCFFQIYQKDEESRLSLYEQKMFYMYLLIKHQFRSELIQSNKGVGFRNFAEYQNRKNQLFEQYDEYNAEAQRLAVAAARKENYIKSFETRIMVLQSQADLKKYIDILDKQIQFADEQSNHYYVLHFPKKAFTEQETVNSFSACVRPRNAVTRVKAERGARELRKYIMKEQGRGQPGGGQRVYGIDACSNEIGCRPETFATEFRYLRKISELRYEIPWYRTAVERYEELGITYHVGEDFLNITDGIRAIDEAIHFLEFRKNDRLGHAIALGIIPEDYYEHKHYSVYQPLQDCLDDIIWMLYRSMEWNVCIPADKREKMRQKAREYFELLYGSHLKEILAMRSGELLDAYYESWQLRGDHPAQYISGKFVPIRKFRIDPYEDFMVGECDRKRLQKFRDDELTAYLYHLYHYDADVKKKALTPVKFRVEKWYIALVGDMQKALRKIIAERQISVECNPTSNVLISNFKYYVKHPALVFNHYRLDGNIEEPNLCISLNTDDIGVFDTSLSYEYALLFRAITRCRHEEGNWNDDAVYEYLDTLRQNGLVMAFRDGTE